MTKICSKSLYALRAVPKYAPLSLRFGLRPKLRLSSARFFCWDTSTLGRLCFAPILDLDSRSWLQMKPIVAPCSSATAQHCFGRKTKKANFLGQNEAMWPIFNTSSKPYVSIRKQEQKTYVFLDFFHQMLSWPHLLPAPWPESTWRVTKYPSLLFGHSYYSV